MGLETIILHKFGGLGKRTLLATRHAAGALSLKGGPETQLSGHQSVKVRNIPSEDPGFRVQGLGFRDIP